MTPNLATHHLPIKYCVPGIPNGSLRAENGFLVIEMRPSTHDETILMRFRKPIAGNADRVVGIWSALDLDSMASAGPMALSRNALSEEEIRVLFDESIEPGDLSLKLK